MNSPNFPELEFRQARNSSLNRSFYDEAREKQNISKFTLGEAPNTFDSSQTSLRIEDLRVKKNHSLRYHDQLPLPGSRPSKSKQILKQRIEEDQDFLDSERENMGPGYQNILNNLNLSTQCTLNLKNSGPKDSIQTYKTDSFDFFGSESKDPQLRSRANGTDYTKIFIPILMQEGQEGKGRFLEIGDTIVDLYKIESVLLKTEKHIIYTVISLISSGMGIILDDL